MITQFIMLKFVILAICIIYISFSHRVIVDEIYDQHHIFFVISDLLVACIGLVMVMALILDFIYEF